MSSSSKLQGTIHHPMYLINTLLLSGSDLCVARAHAFHRLHSSLCGSIAEVNPLLPRSRIKQWSQWDIARLMDSPPPLPPPSLFMCKSIHRVLMAPAMHDTDSFKSSQKKKRESFTHLQSWQKTIHERCIESAFISQDGANVCLPF